MKENTKEKTVVHISKNTLDKIHLMHKYTPLNREWSGVTVFTEGEDKFKNGLPKIIYVEDIIPMNRGNSVYTEFSMGTSPTFTEYILRDENLNKVFNTGLIHTHHNMKAYFSGTDMEELRDNAQHYPYYLSVIVNYKMDIVAKIGLATKELIQTKRVFYAKNSKGKYVPFKNKEEGKEKISCIDFDCTIKLPNEDKKFLELLSILDEQEVKQKKSSKKHTTDIQKFFDELGDFSAPNMFKPNLANKEFIEIPTEDWDTFIEEIEEVESNFQLPDKLKYLFQNLKQYM